MASGQGLTELRLLGHMEVFVHGERVEPPGPKPRALLALLALHPGEVVSVTRAADALWDAGAPAGETQAVQTHVSRLRKALRGAAEVRSRPPGYVLLCDPQRVDAIRFTTSVAEARRHMRGGGHEAARQGFDAALALWRGDALADVPLHGDLLMEAQRLEELRLSAQLDRARCDLALHRAVDAVADLDAVARRHPHDEQVCELRMLALHRAGRQADALAAFRRMRARLVDDLGIEPGERLQALNDRILRGEPRPPSPAPPAAPAPAGDADEAPVRRAARRPPVTVLAAVAVAVAAVVAAATLIDRNPRPAILASASVGAIDPGSGRIVAQVPAAARPVALAASPDGTLWEADQAGGAVLRIDGASRRVVDRIQVGRDVMAVAAGGGSVWAVRGSRQTLLQISPASGEVVRRIPVGNGPRALAVQGGRAWVANALDATVSEIDMDSGRVRAIEVGAAPSAVAVGAGAAWVANEGRGTVTRIDVGEHAAVKTIAVGNGPVAVLAGARDVWVANAVDGTVSRIDAGRDAVAVTVPVGAAPTALVRRPEGLWVATAGDRRLRLLDERTLAVRRTVKLGATPVAATTVDGALWAATAAARPERGGSLLVAGYSEGGTSLDPARADGPDLRPLLVGVTDGLVARRREGGAAGATVVADLARELPGPTDGGLTYRFRLRPGLTYSTGAPVRASDVRASIERLHRLRSRTARRYPLGVVRERACSARRCDLRVGIVADDRAGTVTFRLRRPNPDFLEFLAAPTYAVLPATTPQRPLRGSEIVGTGPYKVLVSGPERTVLVRNPRYRAWGSAADQRAVPDRIVWVPFPSPAERRRADVLLDPPTQPELRRLRLSDPQRVHPYDLPFLQYVFLNTRVPPFDRVLARRAVAYAVDRQHVASMLRRRPPGVLTCQLVPGNFPGYEPYCPFTSRPRAGSAEAPPDFETARKLVAASGTAGAAVTVHAPRDRPFGRTLAGYLAGILRRLGYRPRLDVRLARDEYAERAARRDSSMQIGWAAWQADIPSPSNVLPPLVSCAARATSRRPGTNLSAFCSPAVDARMRQARALQNSEPAAAAQSWAGVDRDVIDAAPVIPLLTLQDVFVTSTRVVDVPYNAFLGTLVTQASLRG